MQEQLTKAAQTADLLMQDIRDAVAAIPQRPEGSSVGDKAIRVVLTEAGEHLFRVISLLARLN